MAEGDGVTIPELQVDSWAFSCRIESGIVNINCFKVMPRVNPTAGAAAQVNLLAVLRVSTSAAKTLAMMLRKGLKDEEHRAKFQIPLDPDAMKALGLNQSDWENIGGGSKE